MIRINLLPGARRQVRASASGSQMWLAGYMGAVVIVGLVLGLVYMSKTQTLDEQMARNNQLQTEIEDLQAQSAGIGEVRAQLEQSRQLENVVSELQRARYGPTNVLMEVSRILSASGGPTVDPQALEVLRRRNPLASFNSGWDNRRLWLTEFREEDRACIFKGVGKTNEDVAEFLRRLALSESFEDVELVKTEGIEDRETEVPVISFELSCRVIY